LGTIEAFACFVEEANALRQVPGSRKCAARAANLLVSGTK
jgi:hypothetical protein